MYKLRKYQVLGVKACYRCMTLPKSKSIVVAPTAAGKSLYIAKTISIMPKVPIVIIQPSKELLKQNYEKFVHFGGVASIYCASLKTKTIDKRDYTVIDGKYKRCDKISRVTFATAGSIMKDLPKLKKLGVKHVFIDEVHLQTKAGSKIRKILKQLGATNVVGLTATPVYLQGGETGSRLVMINRSQATIFRNIAHVTQIGELVKNNYWSPLLYSKYQVDKSALKYNTSGSDFTEESQRTFYQVNDLNKKIRMQCESLIQEGRKKIIVFVPSIQEADLLHKEIKDSVIVHSQVSTKDRDKAVEDFTFGNAKIAINVNVLATGYDNQLIDGIITARPTSSVAIYYQQIGRGVRINPAKKDCKVIDFSGNCEFFGEVEGLRFEEIPLYGWGLFNGRDQLLTDYPINTINKPTKKSLTQAILEENKDRDSLKDIKIWFGKKYNGMYCRKVHEINPSYLPWVYDNFKFDTPQKRDLKSVIEKILRLEKTI